MSANEYDFEERMQARYARECTFGLAEIALPALMGAGSFLFGSGAGTLAGTIGAGLGSLGIPAASTLGSIGAGALEGSAMGALTGGLTGGSPLKGAEFGALGGAATAGLGSAIGGLSGSGTGGATGATGGAGSAAASAPAAASLPVGSAVDPTVGASGVAGQVVDPGVSGVAGQTVGSTVPSASSLTSQLGIGTGAYDPSLSAGTTYGGGPAATGAPAQLGGATPTTGGVTADQALNAPVGSTPEASIGDSTGPSAFDKSSVGQLWNHPSWGNAGNVVASNPGAVVSALGMGYNMMNQGNVKGLNALKQQTAAMQNQSTAMENYLNTGTLPGPLQSGLDQATRNAKQEIKNRYAQLGMSGSTAEASDLAYADVNAQAQKANYELQLYNTGIQEAGLTTGMLKDIVGINQAQDTATGQAISNFASALGGFPLKTNTQAQTTG